MAETTVKNIVLDFGKADSLKAKVTEKKSDQHQFRNLVKEKKIDSCEKSGSLNKNPKTISNAGNESKVRVLLDKSDKETDCLSVDPNQEEVLAETPDASLAVLSTPTQAPFIEAEEGIQAVEDEFVEEDVENRTLEEEDIAFDKSQNTFDVEFTAQGEKETTENAESESIKVSSTVLSNIETQSVEEEQVLDQKLKVSDTLLLSKSNTPIIEANYLHKKEGQSDLANKLAVDPKANIVETEDEGEFLQFSDKKDLKPMLTSMNLSLADTTKNGNKVISAMQKTADQTQKSENSNILGAEEIDPIADVTNFDLGENSGNSNSHKNSSFLNISGVDLEKLTEETFTVSFSEKSLNLNRNALEKPSMQVSFAVSKVLSSTSESDKKQITINLHPQTLGAVKVEILSETGRDGVSKVENIKITAEKASTHILLEEGRKDLEKSLKEVMGTKEESSLQFEMNKDSQERQNAYFASLEEKENWMNQFQGVVSEEAPLTENIVYDYTTRGVANQDEVNLVV